MKRIITVVLLGVVILLGMSFSVKAIETSNKAYGPEEYHGQELIPYKVFGPEEYHGQKIISDKVYGPEEYSGQKLHDIKSDK